MMIAALLNFFDMLKVANRAAELSNQGRYSEARELIKRYY